MATNTTCNSFLLNINSLNNVAASASGNNAALSNSITNLQTIINSSNFKITANTLTSYSGSNITIGANLNLSNAGLYFNSNIGLLSNTINGTPYLAFQTSAQERMRLTGATLGIGTKTPAATLDVAGDAIIRGNLYVSSMGNVYANGFFTPSDSGLKTNIFPYITKGLPTAVRFTWKATGVEDIGVLAEDVQSIEPSCVSQSGAIQTVDYSKLVVLCLAELHVLRSTVASLVERL